MSTQTVPIGLVEGSGIDGSRSAALPVTRDLRLVYGFSLAIALLAAAASIVGLLFPADIYVTDELIMTFVPFDVLNLAAGLPILIGAMWLARRGKLVGLLCWPAALSCMLYSYINRLVGVPFGMLYLPYLFLVAATAYTVIGLVASIDAEAVH